VLEAHKTLVHLQEKKKLEAERQKELDDLFKVVVKQPKVPVGKYNKDRLF